MRHVVTRSVRDSAAVLDVLQGYMTGDWYTAPPPGAAVRATRSAPSPGKLRIGVRTDRAARARDRRSRVRRRGRRRRAAARVARSHGRRSRPGRARRRRAARDVHHRDGLVAARRPRRGRGRSSAARSPPTTWKPVTWANYEAGAAIDAGTLRRARSRRCRRGRGARSRGGSTTASTCCSRRRSPNRRRCSATSPIPRPAAVGLLPFVIVHRAVQRHRPARDVGAARDCRRRASRSACSSSARRTAKTC